MTKLSKQEKLAKAYFEYIDGDVWMDGGWEELSVEVRQRFTERMRASMEQSGLG